MVRFASWRARSAALTSAVLVAGCLVLATGPAGATPPVLSAGCQLLYNAQTSTFAAAGDITFDFNTYNAGEQVWFEATSGSPGVSVQATGPSGPVAIPASFQTPTRYDIPTTGSWKFVLQHSDHTASTTWFARCGLPPTVNYTIGLTGTSFTRNQQVPVTFGCAGVTKPISTCIDTVGDTNGTGFLDTSHVGSFFYYVAALDSIGLQSTTPLFFYTVVASQPTLTWASPPPITYGTPLSATQLDATADVPGTFSYSPPAGTVLHAGANQTLSVTFTPTDTTDYSTATQTTQITVNRATQSVGFTSAAPSNAAVGGPPYLPTASATSGLPATITTDASDSGVCALSGGSVAFTGPGTCTLHAGQPGNNDYLAAQDDVQSFTVAKAATTLTVAPAKHGLLTVTFSAKLTRTYGSVPLPNRAVYFYVNGTLVCHANTNSSGIAGCTKVGVVVNLANAQYAAAFAGDGLDKPSAGAARL